MWYRVRCFILIMAVLALGGCAAPQSPVGESRVARTVRESKGADKAARQTDPEQGVSQALSAGVNIKDKAALAASATRACILSYGHMMETMWHTTASFLRSGTTKIPIIR